MSRYFNTPKFRFTFFASCAVFLVFCVSVFRWSLTSSEGHVALAGTFSPGNHEYYESALALVPSIQTDPVKISDFKKLGERLQSVKDWMFYVEHSKLTSKEKEDWLQLIDTVVSELLPFIQHPDSHHGSHMRRLRATFVPGSRGLVIPTGKKRFRYACHLVANIRYVLKSDLPIQIAYAGDNDLPPMYRDFIASLAPHVSVFDVTTIFDERIAGIVDGGWAIKAFAALGSTFEQLILLDADDVFLQRPDTIFDDHPGYLDRGNLLFHDRLLWQGAFKERHAWWEGELAGHNLSDTIKQSKVYMEGFAEEGDSGVVALDKSRPDVFVGLLHIAWQNTKDVRQKYTYVQGHGDKESWWFGFELTSTPYSMEQHYGAILGHKTGNIKVCSFTIAHVDHKSKLLWYNGSLLKNKEVNLADFDVPSEWMLDGTWEKGATKQHLSCMVGAPVQSIDDASVVIITNTVEQAKIIDRNLNETLPECVTW